MGDEKKVNLIVEENESSDEEHPEDWPGLELHNPSPPPSDGDESTIAGDAIGNTLYSQRWVLHCLMKLNEVSTQESLSENGNENDEFDDDDVQELDSDVETIVCQLWDMTTEKDVVHYLLEVPTLNILTQAISRTKIPRLTEIGMGILANIACVEAGIEKMTSHEKLKFQILHLLDSSDAPTLIELFRMLSCCIRSEAYRSSWVECILNDENFLPHLTFILASSTNTQLLTIVATFIDTMLDNDDRLCKEWSTSEFVDSLLEATTQLNSTANGMYLHILYLLSCVAEGRKIICCLADSVLKVACSFVEHLCVLEENYLSNSKLETGLASVFTLFHILLLECAPLSVVSMLQKERTMVSVIRLVCNSLVSDVVDEALTILCEEIIKQDEGVNLLVQNVETCPDNWREWTSRLPEGKLKEVLITKL